MTTATDGIDFLYLILFLHLLWHCPLRYVLQVHDQPQQLNQLMLWPVYTLQLTILCFPLVSDTRSYLISIICVTGQSETTY